MTLHQGDQSVWLVRAAASDPDVCLSMAASGASLRAQTPIWLGKPPPPTHCWQAEQCPPPGMEDDFADCGRREVTDEVRYLADFSGACIDDSFIERTVKLRSSRIVLRKTQTYLRTKT